MNKKKLDLTNVYSKADWCQIACSVCALNMDVYYLMITIVTYTVGE